MLRISSRYPYNPTSVPDATVSVAARISYNCVYAVDTLRDLAEAFGFQNRWAFCARFLVPPESFGMELPRLRELYREADAILNVCGAHELNEDLLKSERLIYVESDPGVVQVQIDQNNDTRMYLHHRVLFTFGENIGTASFLFRCMGYSGSDPPTLSDRFLEDECSSGSDGTFTTVAYWSTAGEKTYLEWRDLPLE